MYLLIGLGLLLLLMGCSQTRSEDKTFFVDEARLTQCPAPAFAISPPATCLRVRIAPSEAWVGFSNEIKGFSYQENHLYELLVRVSYDPSGMADIPPTYTLLKVISQQAAT